MEGGQIRSARDPEGGSGQDMLNKDPEQKPSPAPDHFAPRQEGKGRGPRVGEKGGKRG